MFRSQGGFSLLELCIVLAVIAILLTVALPSNNGRITQQRVVETLELVEQYKAFIKAYYHATGKFPIDNKAAGLPEADKIIGNYLTRMDLEKGVMQLRLGGKLPASLHGKVLSVQPVYVKDSPSSPVSWICGHDTVPAGMTAAGTNRTTLEELYLPLRCR